MVKKIELTDTQRLDAIANGVTITTYQQLDKEQLELVVTWFATFGLDESIPGNTIREAIDKCINKLIDEHACVCKHRDSHCVDCILDRISG